jgi:cytochrome c oxidase assembly protein Cox11
VKSPARQVFFYIDPDFVADPNMHDVTSIVLSYTFFRSRHQPRKAKAVQ